MRSKYPWIHLHYVPANLTEECQPACDCGFYAAVVKAIMRRIWGLQIANKVAASLATSAATLDPESIKIALGESLAKESLTYLIPR